MDNHRGGTDIELKGVQNVAPSPGDHPASESDGVLVVSVWKQGPEGFLGRLTMVTDEGEPAVEVVTGPDELLDSVRTWLNSLP